MLSAQPSPWLGRSSLGRLALVATLWLSISCEGQGQDAGPTSRDGAGPWPAGAYSFSDELGGFVIEGARGAGTRLDPIVIRETLSSATPVTLVIRTTRPIRPFDNSGLYANGILYLRIEARNGAGQGWVEFEFELQEQIGRPSVFGDGLSFDQREERKDVLSSDSFASFSRDFEPYDRLLFKDGKVDPGARGGFSLLITDYTPKRQFYLVQDPRIPTI